MVLNWERLDLRRMIWYIKSTQKRQGNRGYFQQSLVKLDKVEKIKASELTPGALFYQIFGTIVTRLLTFEPEAFRDKDLYIRQLDSIGVYVLKTEAKKISIKKVTNPTLFL